MSSLTAKRRSTLSRPPSCRAWFRRRGFKRFRNAANTISGIELMRRIRKGQFDFSVLGLKDTAAPAFWDAVLFNR